MYGKYRYATPITWTEHHIFTKINILYIYKYKAKKSLLLNDRENFYEQNGETWKLLKDTKASQDEKDPELFKILSSKHNFFWWYLKILIIKKYFKREKVRKESLKWF